MYGVCVAQVSGLLGCSDSYQVITLSIDPIPDYAFSLLKHVELTIHVNPHILQKRNNELSISTQTEKSGSAV